MIVLEILNARKKCDTNAAYHRRHHQWETSARVFVANAPARPDIHPEVQRLARRIGARDSPRRVRPSGKH